MAFLFFTVVERKLNKNVISMLCLSLDLIKISVFSENILKDKVRIQLNCFIRRKKFLLRI